MIRFPVSTRRPDTRKTLFRTALVENLETRKLLAADVLVGPDLSGRPGLAAEVSAPENRVSPELRKDLVEVESQLAGNYQQLQPIGEVGAGDLQAKLTSVTDSSQVDESEVRSLAWSDYDQRMNAIGAEETAASDVMRRLAANPSQLTTLLHSRSSLTGSSQASLPGLEYQGDGNARAHAAALANTGSTEATIGWFCDTDGELAVHASSSAEGEENDYYGGSGYGGDYGYGSGYGDDYGDGGGDDYGSGDGSDSGSGSGDDADADQPPLVDVPEVDFPQTEFALHDAGLDSYSPSTQSSFATDDYEGGFDSGTDENSNLESLPGVNWSHNTVQTYIDSTHWSITETLIVGYNLTNSENMDQEATTDTGSEEDSNSLSTQHDTSDTFEGTATATRVGFVVMVFHAERGINIDSGAGVAWSLSLSFSDAIGIQLSSSGGRDVTPLVDPALVLTTGDEDDESESDGEEETDPPEELPQDFNSTSSWSSGIGINVWARGSSFVSETPSYVGSTSEIEYDVVLNENTTTGGGLFLTGAWAASSSSGDINDPSTKPGLPDASGEVSPIDGVGGSGDGESIDVPDDGVLDADADAERGLYNESPGAYRPLPEAKGAGHSYGTSGAFASNSDSSRGQGVSVTAKVRGGLMTELSGQMTSGFGQSHGDNLGSDEVFVFSDGGSEVSSTGGLYWHGTKMTGHGMSPSAALNFSHNVTHELGLGDNNEVTTTPSEDVETLTAEGGGGNGRGFSFDHLEINAVQVTQSPTDSRYVVSKSVEASRDDGGSSVVIDITSDVSEPDTGSLTAELSSDGYRFSSTEVTVNATHDSNVPWDGPNYPEHVHRHDVRYSFDQDTWSFLYENEQNTTSTLGAADSVDTEGTSNSKTVETIGYRSDGSFSGEERFTYDHNGYLVQLNLQDYLRNAKFDQVITNSRGFDAAEGSDETNGRMTEGDTEVQVTGHDNTDTIVFLDPNSSGYVEGEDNISWHEETKMDIGDGSGYTCDPAIYAYRTCSPLGNANYDARNEYEHSLDGSTPPAPTYDGYDENEENEYDEDDGSVGELPEDYVYPSNPHASSSFITWVAGKKGDGMDQTLDFTAGVADSMTFNISYATRRMTGADQTNYESGGYVWGQRTGTAVSVVTGGVGLAKGAVAGAKALKAAANSFDDVGRCANLLTKLVKGGCFVPGTLVTLSDIPRDMTMEQSLWSDSDLGSSAWEPGLDWLDPHAADTATAVALPQTNLKVPIEEVPLGARVPTKNPKPWERDEEFPEPDEDTWVTISFTVERTDGGIVDAELLRPRSWAEEVGIEAGKLLPMHIEELQIEGIAYVNSISPAPRIAGGDGSAVTGRFITREVHELCRIEVLASDGQVDTIEGTTIHPIWSVDREDWVPLGELEKGEQLLGAAGPATILTHTISRHATPVYNIEVHGEHVYQVGDAGLFAHNTCLDLSGAKAMTHIRKHAQHARETATRMGLSRPSSLDDVQNFLGTVIRTGSTRIGTWAQEGDVLISRLGDAVVIRKMNGQYLTNLDYAKGGSIVTRWLESTPIHWVMP